MNVVMCTLKHGIRMCKMKMSVESLHMVQIVLSSLNPFKKMSFSALIDSRDERLQVRLHGRHDLISLINSRRSSCKNRNNSVTHVAYTWYT